METKICPACSEEKSLEEFSKSKRHIDGHQSYCKDCRRKYDAENFQRNKERIISHHKIRRKSNQEWFQQYKKNLSCSICGESHPSTLDFHHRDPLTKDNEVGTMMSGSTPSRETFLKEINKCIVLCANCHRKLHWEEKQII